MIALPENRHVGCIQDVTHLASVWCVTCLPCHTGLACPGALQFLEVLLAEGGLLVGHHLGPGSHKMHPASLLPLIPPPLLPLYMVLSGKHMILFLLYMFQGTWMHLCHPASQILVQVLFKAHGNKCVVGLAVQWYGGPRALYKHDFSLH